MDAIDLDWVQSTVANRPFWLPNTLNGHGVADFRAGPQLLLSSINGNAIWTPDVDEDAEVSLVYKFDDLSTTRTLFSITRTASANTWTFLARGESASGGLLRVYYFNNAGSGVLLGGVADNTTGFHTLRIIKQGATITAFRDGTQFATASNARVKMLVAGEGTTPIRVGVRDGTTNPHDGQIADIFISKTILTTDERNNHKQWLRDTYGLIIA